MCNNSGVGRGVPTFSSMWLKLKNKHRVRDPPTLHFSNATVVAHSQRRNTKKHKNSFHNTICTTINAKDEPVCC